jgi:hypothetical protein
MSRDRLVDVLLLRELLLAAAWAKPVTWLK